MVQPVKMSRSEHVPIYCVVNKGCPLISFQTSYQVCGSPSHLWDGQGQGRGIDEAPACHRQIDLALDPVIMDSYVVQDFR